MICVFRFALNFANVCLCLSITPNKHSPIHAQKEKSDELDQ